MDLLVAVAARAPVSTAETQGLSNRDVRYRRFSVLPTGSNRKSDFDVTYR